MLFRRFVNSAGPRRRCRQVACSHGRSKGRFTTDAVQGSSDEALLNEFISRSETHPELFSSLIKAPSMQTAMMLEFEKIDTSKDGLISPQEFKNWVNHNFQFRAATARPTQVKTEGATAALTKDQIRKLAVQSAIPFVGFGFLDNAVMIVAGSQIDAYFSTIGLSALAAAALGNTVSDVAGIKAGGFIEAVAAKMGLPDPGLTIEQIKSTTVKKVTLMSSAVGIMIGCLLGMCPLLFIENDSALKKVFDEIDLDKSGDITIEELQFAIQAVGLQVTEEELLAAFKMASIDAVRHKITFKEFKLLVKQFEDKMKREGYSAE
jgi:hypothetical protein